MKEHLIIAVQNRPALWDKRHKNHHNRHFLDKEWKAVANELNVTEKDVKQVWKNLRDEFRKQFNKTPRSGAAAPESSKSNWKYYNSMLFLGDQFEPRRSSGNLVITDDAASASVGAIEDVEALDDIVEEGQTNSPSVTTDHDSDLTEIGAQTPSHEVRSDNPVPVEDFTRTGFKRRLTVQARIGQELINLEKEKLKLKMSERKKTDEFSKNDEDVGFFNSLLPHVKTLDPRKKMLFRMKVQELLFDMAYSPENDPYRNRPPSAMSQRYDYPHTDGSYDPQWFGSNICQTESQEKM